MTAYVLLLIGYGLIYDTSPWWSWMPRRTACRVLTMRLRHGKSRHRTIPLASCATFTVVKTSFDLVPHAHHPFMVACVAIGSQRLMIWQAPCEVHTHGCRSSQPLPHALAYTYISPSRHREVFFAPQGLCCQDDKYDRPRPKFARVAENSGRNDTGGRKNGLHQIPQRAR